MTTRMTHPLHGATHAYDAGEVARLEKLGWEAEKLSIPGVRVMPAVDSPVPAVSLHEPVQKKKPGPKPKAKQ